MMAHLIHLSWVYMLGGPRETLKIVCQHYHHHRICTLKV